MKYLLLALGLALAACGPSPTPTGTVCPDPDPGTPNYDDFGKPFFKKYCSWCHDSSLKRSMRNGAPVYHDYDTLEKTVEILGHTDEQAGIGPEASNHFMPPQRCPSDAGGRIDTDCEIPTDDERRELALFLACEKNRPHNFRPDAGVDADVDAQ